MSNVFASSKNALRICQRSGLKYPYNEVIREPGTGLWVHYSESDGAYNRIQHPQLHIKGVSDKIGLRNPLPDVDDSISYITDENGNYLIGGFLMFGVEEYVLSEEENN
jgi:hypothetical protein